MIPRMLGGPTQVQAPQMQSAQRGRGRLPLLPAVPGNPAMQNQGLQTQNRMGGGINGMQQYNDMQAGIQQMNNRNRLLPGYTTQNGSIPDYADLQAKADRMPKYGTVTDEQMAAVAPQSQVPTDPNAMNAQTKKAAQMRRLIPAYNQFGGQ